MYLLAVPFFCGKERYFNSILMPLCFMGLYRLRRIIVPHEKTGERVLTALTILTLPVLFDTSILFYTDLLSLTSIVFGFSCKNSFYAALFFTLGTFTRQTNIVWAGMYCLLSWFRSFDKQKPFSSAFNEIVKHFPFIILGVSFIAFVFVNKGIVLGDRSAHQPVFHAPQFFYCLTFITISSLPICIVKCYKNTQDNPIRKIFECKFTTVIVFTTAILSAKYFTYAHPYLLADNRHFTFYLWHWWFQRNWFLKYLNAPVYLISFLFVTSSMSTPTFHKILLLLLTAVTCIPAPLLEFRYFIIPFTLWRLTVSERRFTLYLELLQNLFVSIFALYMFFNRPFKWVHEPADVQRFMW